MIAYEAAIDVRICKHGKKASASGVRTKGAVVRGQATVSDPAGAVGGRKGRVKGSTRFMVHQHLQPQSHASFCPCHRRSVCRILLPAYAQVTTTVDCDLMGLVVNVGTDSNSVNLWGPGGYLIRSHRSTM